jgi:hypothetical protein
MCALSSRAETGERTGTWRREEEGGGGRVGVCGSSEPCMVVLEERERLLALAALRCQGCSV